LKSPLKHTTTSRTFKKEHQFDSNNYTDITLLYIIENMLIIMIKIRLRNQKGKGKNISNIH